MAVKTNITINIVEPGSDVPVPDTGLFTHGIGGTETTIIVSAALVTVLVILSIVLTTYMYRKHKKQGRTAKLVHIIDQTKAVVKSKKRITIGLSIIALLVSACTFTAFMLNTNNSNTSAIEGNDTEQQTENTNNLTINAESKELTIEVKDQPVFAVLPVQVTVEEATQAGYTLTAYTDNTDLVSTTNPNNKIPMVTVEGDEPVALEDNTYGLSLEEPTSKDEGVYTTLSTDQDNPTIIKSMTEYSPTEAEDKTTIYYGFYITPDIPYGTYTNDSEVHYNATINTTLVTFDGNDLYFDGDEGKTTNEVEYIAVAQEESEDTINQIISGEYKEPSQALPYNFLGWSEEQEATTPTYTSAEDIVQNLLILPNQPIILYAIWQKAITITYDANGGTGTMTTQTIIAGESDNLSPNEFTREGYTFTGWNTEAEPTEQEPGKAYADQAEYTAPAISQNITLYAQWEKVPVIGDLTYMQDFATLSETGKTSVLNSMAEEQQYQLKDSRDQKDYYISKLKDGNIWMTQNLDLDIAAGRTYTSADTDLANSTIGTSWTPTVSTSTTSSWTSSTTAPSSYDPGNLYWNGNVITSSGTLSNRTTTDPSATSGGTHYHVGNYYNWTAAVAMNSSSSYTTDYTDVNQSICPAGWRLPTYSGDKSYLSLKNAQGLTAGTSGNIQSSPTYFVYGGLWDGGSLYVGYSGIYWSSVVKSSSNSYLLNFDANGSLRPQTSGHRNVGYSLRCVAR